MTMMRTLNTDNVPDPDVCLFMEVLPQTTSVPLSHFLPLPQTPAPVRLMSDVSHHNFPAIVSQPLIGLWLLSSLSPSTSLPRDIQWNVLIG